MDIQIKVGSRHKGDKRYWMDGQIIDMRETGFKWGKLDRTHHCIITTPHDFWDIRGTTDWKSTKQSMYDLKKYLTIVDSVGKYPWETFAAIENITGRKRNYFIDFKWLLEQRYITPVQYKDIYNRGINPGKIYINVGLTSYIFHEDSRVRLDEKQNMAVSTGTFQIGTGGGADYATVTAFEADIADPLTGNLTGEHQNEETAISGAVVFATETGDNLLKLTAESGAEHNGGAYGNGARIQYGTSDYIQFNEVTANDLRYIEISNLALDISGAGNYGVRPDDCGVAGLALLNRLLIKGDGDSLNGVYENYSASPSGRITNCIMYGIGDADGEGGTYNNPLSSQVWDISNNTVIKCGGNGIEWHGNGTNCTMKNNLVQGCGNLDYDLGATPSTNSKNISEDGTSPNGDYDDTDVHTDSVFKDYANDDYRLDSEGDATNLAICDDGDDLSGTFTDDVEGQTRDIWYIGASEIVAEEPPEEGQPAIRRLGGVNHSIGHNLQGFRRW